MVKRSLAFVTLVGLFAILVAACSQAAPAPTQAPAAPKAGEPTKAAAQAAPAASFPQKGKAINVLVGLSAGSGTDIAARLMASALEKQLGTPVTVTNKPGASGIIAMTEMVNSKPDGYTLGTINFLSAMLAYMDPQLKATYSRKNFQPVAHFVLERNVLVVNGSSKYKTLKDLVDDAKANPGKVKFGASGILGNPHVAVLMLEKAAGVKFTTVQFPGVADALTAMYGGNVDAVVTGGSTVVGQTKSGQVRPLGIVDKEENEYYPGVKTLQSMGYDVVAPFSVGFAGPAGMPAETTKVLSDAIGTAFNTPAFQDKVKSMSQTAAYMDTAEYTKYWDSLEPGLKPIIDLAREETK